MGNVSKWRESEIEEIINRQNSEKKWELAVNQMKERYENQIDGLRQNIKFLLLKLENLQDHHNKNYSENQGFANSALAQSKIMMMSSSNHSDSFRFTPNNSFSSSIKDSLTRRDSMNAKTPSKKSTSRFSQNIGFLLDRTNA